MEETKISNPDRQDMNLKLKEYKYCSVKEDWIVTGVFIIE